MRTDRIAEALKRLVREAGACQSNFGLKPELGRRFAEAVEAAERDIVAEIEANRHNLAAGYTRIMTEG